MPTRIDAVALRASLTPATIQRSLYGSYCTRGSNGFTAPAGAQKLVIETSPPICAPVVLSCTRKLLFSVSKTLLSESGPTAPIVSGGIVKNGVPGGAKGISFRPAKFVD